MTGELEINFGSEILPRKCVLFFLWPGKLKKKFASCAVSIKNAMCFEKISESIFFLRQLTTILMFILQYGIKSGPQGEEHIKFCAKTELSSLKLPAVSFVQLEDTHFHLCTNLETQEKPTT